MAEALVVTLQVMVVMEETAVEVAVVPTTLILLELVVLAFLMVVMVLLLPLQIQETTKVVMVDNPLVAVVAAEVS